MIVYIYIEETAIKEQYLNHFLLMLKLIDKNRD